MADLIVALSDLPAIPPIAEGYELAPAKAWDREVIVDWVFISVLLVWYRCRSH
ncbi:hypothetical protein [Saccharospirillum sp.]|uniref:hypothetical protein n=1 Tax=Saccharospirillum sp. TaxID=2033801 RepID=UPI0034A07F19